MKYKIIVLDDNGVVIVDKTKTFEDEKEARNYWLNETGNYQSIVKVIEEE